MAGRMTVRREERPPATQRGRRGGTSRGGRGPHGIADPRRLPAAGTARPELQARAGS